MTNSAMMALQGIRILDLTEERGLYAGKLLADLGADVIRIEPPQGGKARRIPPFAKDEPGLETSLCHINFNTNKRGVTLDIQSQPGKDVLRRLAAKADVLIEDFDPGTMAGLGLDYTILSELNPRLVMSSITAFGQTGPYSRYKAPNPIGFAMGGLTFVNGPREERPVVAPCDQSYHAVSITAAFGIVTALLFRRVSGQGQYIDVATHEVLARFTAGIQRYSLSTEIDRRAGSQFGGVPGRIYPCKDGFVHILAIRANHWQSFLEIIGTPDLLSGKEWQDGGFRVRNVDLIDPFVIEFTMAHDKMEIARICQAKGIPCTPVNTVADFANDEHVKLRGFVGEVEHPVIGRHRYLGTPYRLSETPCAVKRPAPLLGQHNQEVFGELGYGEAELKSLKAEGVI